MKLAERDEDEFCGTTYGPGVVRIQNAFKKKMFEYGESLKWCSHCKHKWFDTVLVKVSDDDDTEICTTRASQQEKYKVALFSHVNGMDPHDNFRFSPTELPKADMLEEECGCGPPPFRQCSALGDKKRLALYVFLLRFTLQKAGIGFMH